jgi:hypothetical protein
MRLATRAISSVVGLVLAGHELEANASPHDRGVESHVSRERSSNAEGPGNATSSNDEAETPLRVVLELHADAREMLPLLRAELEGLGLEVVERSHEPASSNREVAPEWSGEAFHIVVKPQQVEVWILDVEANTIVHHEVFAKADGSPLAMRTAVLHAVELLGWNLRERQRKVTLQRATATHESSETKGTSPTSTQWLITVMPLLLHSPGGTDPSGGAALDLTWQRETWGVRLSGGGSLWPNELRRAEGSIQITPRWLGLAGVGTLRVTSRLRTSLSAGANAISVSLHGRTELAIEAHEDHFLTVAPCFETRSFYAFDDSLALGLSAAALVPLRSDVMLIDEEAVGRYGRVILTLGLGIQAALR